jgi:phosphatidylserine/phosphatidylglycerophosphate/cardiolipin synthase-like enzyme
VHLVHWGRGGFLEITTPFIADFEVGRRDVSAHIMQVAKLSTNVRLVVAPPNPPPHRRCRSSDPLKCHRCMGAARKVDLLDRYSQFATELMIKNNLHAKIYVATNPGGRKLCLTGSVNLTRQGFFEKAELGIYTTDPDLIAQIETITQIWKSPKNLPAVQDYRTWRKDFLALYPDIITILRLKAKWN